MKLTNSQEEYLKAIYILENTNQKVRVTDIAKKLNITKPSVNKAIKILNELGLINYETYGNITLTKDGERLAKMIIKRYDTIKMFLVDILNIEARQAEKEAESMKHSISENTQKRLAEYINKILDLGDLDCGYDKNSDKCKNCVKITAKNRLLNTKKIGGNMKC